MWDNTVQTLESKPNEFALNYRKHRNFRGGLIFVGSNTHEN